ncbi:hypothetical protein [Chryseobacterium paridis]|uniref:TonB C-terminal domain-containing protein n=1 Tax=Chryseobacterium paridis TaxID=2800328 RepID=A0ABS1FUG9_9FLAO|nr:hypothetical protein [Chryseobacterium paridis]MBK1896008.1 hypothetical protein [Chryseobacterium paridis]
MKIKIALVLLFFLTSKVYSQFNENKQSYYNPIENKTYQTEHGFKTYQDGKEINNASRGEKETKLEKVILLSSNADFEGSVSTKDISEVVSKTDKIFNDLFKNSKKSGKIMVQFELNTKKNDIQFAVMDDLDLDIMKIFEKKVNKEKYPKSKNNSIKFQLIYKVNSYND